MKKNLIDKALEVVLPSVARRRMQERIKIDRIEEIGIRRYDGASRGKNTDDWRSNSSSSNVEVQQDLVTLRNRSRELTRNNPYIKNWLRVMANNIVGTGIIPTPKVLSRHTNEGKIKDLWKLFAEDTQCDYDQRLTFYGLQSLILRSAIEGGECLIVRRRAKSTYAFPLRYQVLEADFIDTGKFSMNNEYGGITWYGIEFNKDGERVGYWLWNRHPGEFATQSLRVDAKDVIHVYNIERPGQIRGVPENHASMLAVRDLKDYEYAEQLRAKIAACMVGAIQQDETGKDSLASSFETMEPGSLFRMNPGESIVFNTPPTSNGYPAFVDKNLHGIAAGAGITYESMTGDFSNVNFSSGRMGWLEMQRNINHWQQNVVIPACNGLYQWFIEACQVAGYVPLNTKVKANWTPPRREMIDPVKEIKALTDEVRAKFKTWAEAVRERGDNPEDIFDDLKEEFDMFKDAGLKPVSLPEFDTGQTTDTITPSEENTNHPG